MEIKIPEVGESVHEALLARWFKKSGDHVNKDEALCELETDKITLDLHADVAGILNVQAAEGSTLPVGAVIGIIVDQPSAVVASDVTPGARVESAFRDGTRRSTGSSPSLRREMREKGGDPPSVAAGAAALITKNGISNSDTEYEGLSETAHGPLFSRTPLKPAPAAAHITAPAAVMGLDHTGQAARHNAGREERRPMSPLRRRIAEHLLAARQQTAMLTTFNEADLSRVKQLRTSYRDHYRMLHGVPLGMMPFFVKACVEALKEYPGVNASIDGDDLVFHNYYDLGIAIGAEKGLVVPILRDADRMQLFEIDRGIAEFAEKIKTNRLAISDIEGGTFSISNGGIYGSMLSTPIINVPQSGILGMHAIQNRPVARDGQVVIRPMMYLALSYDHRIVDGREAVGFLMKVRAVIENPEEYLPELQGVL